MNKLFSVSKATATVLFIVSLLAGCGNGGTPNDSEPKTTGIAGASGAASNGSAGTNAGLGGGAATGTVTVSISESAFGFETPDLIHNLTATVTGNPTTTVVWSSSDTHIATVSDAGAVTSVSGGEATITATSTADGTKSASSVVTVAEPNRPRAATYVDAKTISAGPVKIFTAGDSLTRTYAANAADQTGWGQVLAQFLSSDAEVDNALSNGGRSSRSFYNEVGRWNQVKARLAAAQTAGVPAFVFIMFGHNDQKKKTDTDGPLYLTFAAQNPNQTVAGTYYDYLERYIVETRALGGIPILFTPFVRQYLEGSPATLTIAGQHNITAPYAGETSARGDYPAAAKAVAAKHDVPLIDITSWSKALVEAHAASSTLRYIYISGDQTHVRNLGALLMAQEAVRALNEQGILTSYAKPVAARVSLDTSSLAFGGLFAGKTLDKSLLVTGFGDVSGSLTLTAPANYSVSTNGTDFSPTASIACDSSFVGAQLFIRFAPTDTVAYNSELTIAHSLLPLDYGNTTANAKAGVVTLTGNGKVPLVGTPASASWPLFSGSDIVLGATIDGAITATSAKLSGLVNKNVNYGAARFDTPDGIWPAESARNPARYAEFSLSVATGSFTLDEVIVGGGSGGGSAARWDIVYSLTPDFAAPTALATGLSGAKDTLTSGTYPSLGVPVAAGQTLYLRVYPYNPTGATSGKTIMLANVVVSGATN